MSSRAVPADLLPWAQSRLGEMGEQQQASLAVVAGDASHRRYFRLAVAGGSVIVVHAPPATEKNEAFLAVRDLLEAAGVRVPALHGADPGRGYLLLEDLGDQLLLPALADDTVEYHYQRAREILLHIAGLKPGGLDLPPYDNALLQEELGRFPTWFLEALLGYSPDAEEQRLLQALFRRLVDSALEQPRVLVHRDFHSRNLMLQADGQLAVIDFQDAVVGPVTYDLVSLLRDCYVHWPPERVRAWALVHRDALQARGLLAGIDDERFLRWFDWMGLQRHIKVLGTFARLYLRDGKPAYLEDLPLVIEYVREISGKYASEEAVFAAFADWFEGRLAPVIARQDWSAGS